MKWLLNFMIYPVMLIILLGCEDSQVRPEGPGKPREMALQEAEYSATTHPCARYSMTRTGTVSNWPSKPSDMPQYYNMTWVDPSNAEVSDNSYAWVANSITCSDATSNGLRTKQMNFNIPWNALIRGISVSIEKRVKLSMREGLSNLLICHWRFTSLTLGGARKIERII
jgi:hypothetical protein